MAVYKDGDKWRVIYRFTNWKGERKQTQKRGFATKREAQAYEREIMLKQSGNLDMTFESFFLLYEADKTKRVKKNTCESKSHVIRTKILPYFGKRKIAEIEPKDVIAWQNELLSKKQKNGEAYSPSYLKTIHAQLSAIFNHAVRYYHLPSNPAQQAGTMGSEEHKEMLFWTKEEYLKFADEMMDKPVSYYAFEMLYWCGMRLGEMLALTPADFDFAKGTVTIESDHSFAEKTDSKIDGVIGESKQREQSIAETERRITGIKEQLEKAREIDERLNKIKARRATSGSTGLSGAASGGSGGEGQSNISVEATTERLTSLKREAERREQVREHASIEERLTILANMIECEKDF